MNRADRAEELFRQGYNCCQSVFAAFADLAGLTTEEAAKIASPFGAGFGKMREVCGAVSGMTLLAGYLDGYSDPADYESKKELYALIQKMCAEFEAREGSLICRELLGLQKGEDLGEPSVRTEEYYRSRPCIGACRTAAEIAEKHLPAENAAPADRVRDVVLIFDGLEMEDKARCMEILRNMYMQPYCAE